MIRSTKELNTIICTCRNLKHLDIPSGDYDVAEISLENWINFQNLEYLNISCNITPELANAIVKYCKNLKHLCITNSYHQVTNETALKKLTKLENLESLVLLYSIELSEESIIAISNNCKKLKRLEIPGCVIVPSIPGDSLLSPSVLDELSELQHLEHLDLRAAKNLEDSTIIAIANNCTNLKSLVISGCIAITEKALFALTKLESLQKLDVSVLDISDSFIIKLKGLKELCCVGCEKLTDTGIIQFIKNNPDLEEISVWDVDNVTIESVIAADRATKNRTNVSAQWT
ncbi:F-box/LRR-repeat protein fbxl-1-like [Aphidius gifuensis]|uniref:F-box/LRR-repeat protein fbxl-1-like n=1 Tax=Aphidius gifuensis TaxID=684658 RepID=UPI001CDC5BA3|nr:F-box/LRR-repeat protein fbxl-1-like [Aphidius gifuensis]